MNFSKRFFMVFMSVILLLTTPMNIFAANVDETDKEVHIINELPNGEIEEIYINENREVFVNGKNITTIISVESEDIDNIALSASDDDWIYAGVNKYRYDLTGLSITGLVSIINALGGSLSASVAKSLLSGFLVDNVFSAGMYLEDVRYIYYKNINKPRPDMKEEHDLYFVCEALNFGSARIYLTSFTTYGGI